MVASGSLSVKEASNNYLPQYAVLFKEIDFPDFLSEDAIDIITRFLDVNDETRLGSGPYGVKEIKDHPFFKNIDWELLEQKLMDPPQTEKCKQFEEVALYSNFESMMSAMGHRYLHLKNYYFYLFIIYMIINVFAILFNYFIFIVFSDWVSDKFDTDNQKYFKTWFVLLRLLFI